MLLFKEPELSDRPAAESIFFPQPYRLIEFNFSDIYIWRKTFDTKIAFEKGFLLVKLLWKGKPAFLFPAGDGDLKEIIRLLHEEAVRENFPLRFLGMTSEMVERLQTDFPDQFEFVPVRDSFDYIYRSEDLIQLAGRKYHSKRNHISRFRTLGEWRYEEIGDSNFAEVIEMNDLWCEQNGCGKEKGMQSEFCAVRQALWNYKALGFDGGLIRLNGRVVAFSIGQRLCGDTYVVHIEKALDDADGAYAVINREFAEHNCSDYAYINREDDAGVEGLRKAKLSYHPAILLEKNIASLKEGISL